MMDGDKKVGERGGAPAGDAHAAILQEATKLRQASECVFRDADQTSALGPLLESARIALERTVPSKFEHIGRTYFLRVSLAEVRLMIFENASTLTPLAFAMSSSAAEFGHEPPL